jgi:four helix bundle protein
MAIKSTTEYENHLEKARGARLISERLYKSFLADTIEVRKMLIGLRKKLRGSA